MPRLRHLKLTAGTKARTLLIFTTVKSGEQWKCPLKKFVKFEVPRPWVNTPRVDKSLSILIFFFN